jgi:pimeloyl-ACP methyl ester carboxylesterase
MIANMNRRKVIAFGASAAAVAATRGVGVAQAERTDSGPSDAALARSLRGGFRSEYATVNGIRLHYVAGGRGDPLVLLPGWPQTWWEFRKIMPALADRYRVIAVDMRGMGGSDKPESGYDKRTAARDIHELVRRLGYDRVNIAGHDIGSMVAYSFAVNHAAATRKVALMDVAHPTKELFDVPMLPQEPPPVHVWWFAFNQLRGLPEQLVSGRSRFLVDWLFDHLMVHPEAIAGRDRDIFARAYSRPDAIRAGNGWYQAFYQDIADQRGYGPVTAPRLGLAADPNYGFLQYLWPAQGTDVRVVKVADAGHFFTEEQPEFVVDQLIRFFG